MKGSIRQGSPGSWEFTVDQGGHAIGKRRRKHLTDVPDVYYSTGPPSVPTTATAPHPPSASRCGRPSPRRIDGLS